MEIGVVFPQTEIGADAKVVRAYAETAEELGYRFFYVYDHVIGANPDRPDRLTGPYTYRDSFLEPLALFGYLAAATKDMKLLTGILILPQRQTVLVAKQAATVDVLSGGRLILGVGLGWNHVEYESLGETFGNRGARVEEQIDVLRKLWQEELVTYEGRWHTIKDAGLNPLPVQRPIPIWMGGVADRALRRAARMADGYLPQFQPGPEAQETLAKLHQFAREAGRDPKSMALAGRLNLSIGGPDEWVARTRAWQELGATHVGINTMGMGLDGPADHIDAIRRCAQAITAAGISMQ